MTNIQQFILLIIVPLFGLSYVCHFRHSFKLRNMYCETIHNIILWVHFHNLVTSKPEEGLYGRPKYCLLWNITLWISLAVVFEFTCFICCFGWLDLSLDPTFTAFAVFRQIDIRPSKKKHMFLVPARFIF